MVEIYEQQITRLDDLTEISALLSEDPNFQKSLQKYINNPYDADVERVAKGVFTLAVSKAESPSLDRYDATIAITKANNEALSKLACTGARYLTTKTTENSLNMLSEVLDRWSPYHASSKVPEVRGMTMHDIYSRFIEDGSFIRLKNVTLGYSLPSKLLSRIKVSKLRLYMSANNLYCLTRYSGYDPEVSVKSSPLMPGLDYGAYPKNTAYTMGLEITF